MNVEYLRPDSAKNLDIDQISQSPDLIQGVDREGKRIENGGGEDKVTISDEARALLLADKLAHNELEKLSTVREEKVEEAVKNVNSGHYSRQEVIERIANSLLSV